MTKVIHVHLIQGRKNYYFGSIPAIYSTLTADDIGIKQCSLERVGLSKGGVVLNKKAIHYCPRKSFNNFLKHL